MAETVSLAADTIAPSATDFDASRFKARFPLLAESHPDLHYLDNAATSHKPIEVIDALGDCYRHHYGPVHRGLYRLAEDASERYELARKQVAAVVGADPGQLVFTRSSTESINMVARGWARTRLEPGDQIWVSALEHHANYLPWQTVCREAGATLKVLELDEIGRIKVDESTELFG